MSNFQLIKFVGRFLAKRFHLAGTTDLEQAEVDMYVDQVADLVNEMVKVHYESDEAKKAEITAVFQGEILPKHLTIFETKLNQTNSGYLVGKGLTFADLFLISILEWLGDKKSAAFEHFPALKKHDETVRALPNIAKWLQSRPVTAM
jgi:glutathione S-transferase